MFDFDQLMKGYTKEDEFIARDLILINLLIDKGIITKEDIDNAYSKLSSMIEDVKKVRYQDVLDKANRYKDIRGDKSSEEERY